MRELTEKQQAVFDYLLDCVRDENYVPTMREIASRFGFKSTNGVRDHLVALERKGYILRRDNVSRGIQIAPEFLDGDESARGLPIVGRVAAGAPITAIENLEGYLELDTLYDRDRHYALRVRGDSMVDAGIQDGDFCIVREQPNVDEGEIAVAVVEGEATVKRIYRKAGVVELRPENELYRPLFVNLEDTDFRIGGKVVGIHRVL